MPGTYPSIRCRSVPLMLLAVTFTMASREFSIRGSGTVSTDTFSTPTQHSAFMPNLPSRRTSDRNGLLTSRAAPPGTRTIRHDHLAGLQDLLHPADRVAYQSIRLGAGQAGDDETEIICGWQAGRLDPDLGAPPA